MDISAKNIAGNYNEYYAPIMTEGGEKLPSLYAKRFGEYAIPATEVLMITALVIQALAENYPLKFADRRNSFSVGFDSNAVSKLISFAKAANRNISAEQVYQFLIEDKIAESRLVDVLPDRPITLNIMDFGCGDGRHLQLYTVLAEVFKQYGVGFKFCCYEISQQALDIYKEKAATEFGFKVDPTDQTRLNGDNVSLKFVLSKNADAPAYVKKELIYREMLKPINVKKDLHLKGLTNAPIFDISLCLFGVLAHVVDRKERGKIIKLLHDMTSCSVLLTVPTQKFFEDPQINIVEENQEGGFVKYKVGDSILPYVLFGGRRYDRVGAHNDIFNEIGEVTSKTGMGVMQLSSSIQYSRPTKVSHDLVTYIREFARSTSSAILHKFNPIYQFAVMRPDAQRENDRHQTEFWARKANNAGSHKKRE